MSEAVYEAVIIVEFQVRIERHCPSCNGRCRFSIGCPQTTTYICEPIAKHVAGRAALAAQEGKNE